ncbi:Hsp33 family molecular chaperone HslO [Arenimonas sp.]|jgi:molecular chaperone Hsp33|uniref:Hsp33 family molecular chaperone HslO n=1 Tax=Arenimonas sp. TaxID=1872635 RepID=UPI0037BE5CA9
MPIERDSLTRFLLNRAHVRGALVRLGETWRDIAERTAYPPAVADQLAQCTAASALFTASLKIKGRVSIQLRGDASVRRLFAECTTEGTLRAIAHFDAPVPESLHPADYGDKAMLAITIENEAVKGREPQRYQGMVGLQADSLSEAFEGYFRQSEQLPTRILLFSRGDEVAGMLIQQLPEKHCKPEDWRRAQMLFDTLRPEELFDLAPEDILYRLFHEESVRVLETKPLCFACSCNRERVENALISLGRTEIEETLADTGDITVHCDFCGQAYRFTAEQGLSLFWPKSAPAPNDRLH